MNKGVILIVSTEAELTQLLQKHFEAAGQSVLAAHSKDEALALARQSLPQAAILDTETSGLDFADLTQSLRASPRTRHIHITLLAPHAKRDDRLLALSAGADEFMTKPIDAEELGLRIRNALRRAEFQNLVNPTTGLPGPHLIEDRLRELLREENDWALIRSSVRGLKAFTDAYGFLAGEEVLRFAVQVITQTVNQLGTPDDFIGHTGSDNFVVVTALDRADGLRQALIERFAEGVRSHYSFREREQGHMVVKLADGGEMRVPLMSLYTQLITSKQGPFYDIFELTQMQ